MPTPHPLKPIRLYGAPLSGHAHRVKLFLSLLGLPFETIELDLRAGDNRRPEFLALNPFGQVPVIEDGELVLFDSNAILVYLAKQYGDPSWLPQDPVGAAAVQRWFSLAAGQINYGPYAARLVKAFGVPLDYASATAITAKLFAVLETELQERPFATGTVPTLADIAAYSYIALAPEGGISLEPYPNLRNWLRRIEALPRFIPAPAAPAAAHAA